VCTIRLTCAFGGGSPARAPFPGAHRGGMRGAGALNEGQSLVCAESDKHITQGISIWST